VFARVVWFRTFEITAMFSPEIAKKDAHVLLRS
jgi:hypothetical protein